MKTSTVRPSSYREWQENDKEEDSDWICIDDGNLFEGTRMQFENCFFSNAENYCILDWVEKRFNGLEVEFYKNE